MKWDVIQAICIPKQNINQSEEVFKMVQSVEQIRLDHLRQILTSY